MSVGRGGGVFYGAFEVEGLSFVFWDIGISALEVAKQRWWLHYTQQVLASSYLRALLLASTIGKPIPHFRSKGFYDDLLAGKDPVVRLGTKRFKIMAGDDGIVQQRPQACQPKRRRVVAKAGSTGQGVAT